MLLKCKTHFYASGCEILVENKVQNTSLEKCKVMHIAHSCKTEYDMGPENNRVKLQETDGERDLGVFITRDLKPAMQCEKAAAKAMSMLGMIKRHF